MGCLWASHIDAHLRRSQSKHSVKLLLHTQESLAGFERQGNTITIESDEGIVTNKLPAFLTTSFTSPISHLLLTCKAQDVSAAIASAKHFIGPRTLIILLQNGLKPHFDAVDSFGEERVISISTSTGAYVKEPFHIFHAGLGETWIGQMGSDFSHSRALVTQLPADTLHIRHDPDICSRLWRKFAINCCINILTSLYDIPNGELLTHPQASQEFPKLCHEVASILHSIPEASAVSNLLSAATQVAKATANNISSTLQDVRKGKVTELSQLNTYLCHLALEQGCSCQFNQALLERFAKQYPALAIH